MVLPALGRPTIIITSQSSFDLGPASSEKVGMKIHASLHSECNSHHGYNTTVSIALFVLAHFWPGQGDPYQLAGWGNTPLGDQRQMPTKR